MSKPGMTRFALLVLMLSVASAREASAQLPVFRIWPDTTPPCNGTLQACVDASFRDDAIEIATNGPIHESITLDKSTGTGFPLSFRITGNDVAGALDNDATGIDVSSDPCAWTSSRIV